LNDLNEPPPIDLASALERTGGEMDFLSELVDMYMEDFEEKYAAIKDAVYQKDVERLRELAHSLKGSSANLGLKPLQETFFLLEMAGRDNNLLDAQNKIDLLYTQFNQLKSYWENRNHSFESRAQMDENSKDHQISIEDREKNDPQENSDKIKIQESIKDIVPAYIENRRSDIEKIYNALEAGDISIIETLAYKMKGSGTSYGFERISQLGRQIELSAKDNDRDKIRLNVRELELFLENIQHE